MSRRVATLEPRRELRGPFFAIDVLNVQVRWDVVFRDVLQVFLIGHEVETDVVLVQGFGALVVSPLALLRQEL